MKSRLHLFALLLSIPVVLLSFPGCVTPSYPPEEAPEMIVVSDFAPFYSMGPQQINGPDASLRTDTIVRLIRREFGYSYVQLEDGRFGYMPSQTLQPAPPRPAIPPPPAEGSSRSRGNNDDNSAYSGPPVEDFPMPDLNEIPLEIPAPVLLDDEETPRKPEFRL